jgi:hypothetical protein
MEKAKKFILEFWFFLFAMAMCIQENVQLLEGIGLKQETVNLIRLCGVFVIFFFNNYINKNKKK